MRKASSRDANMKILKSGGMSKLSFLKPPKTLCLRDVNMKKLKSGKSAILLLLF